MQVDELWKAVTVSVVSVISQPSLAAKPSVDISQAARRPTGPDISTNNRRMEIRISVFPSWCGQMRDLVCNGLNMTGFNMTSRR